MGLLSLLLNRIIPLSLVVIILATIIWVLNYKNKKLNSVLQSERTRFSRYKIGVEMIKDNGYKTTEKNFEALNRYIRAFFKEYLQLDFSLTYLELEKLFRGKEKPEYAELCRLMSEANYSGKKTKEEIKKLAAMFYKILESY